MPTAFTILVCSLILRISFCISCPFSTTVDVPHLVDGITCISIPCLPITTLASHFLPGWYSPLLLVSWHHYCHATSEGHLTMLNLNISTIDINGIFIFIPMQYKPMLLNLWAPPPFFLIHGQWHAKHKKMSKNPRRNAVLVYPCLVFYCLSAIVYDVVIQFFYWLLVSLTFRLSTI